MSEICVIIARKRQRMVHEEMDQARKHRLRMLEIRLDYLNKPPRLSEILERRFCPLIATVRRQADGGLWRGDEDSRLRLLRQAIASGFDWVDLEHDVAGRISRFGSTRRLVSYHSFDGVPDDLEAIVAGMSELDADVLKIACRTHDPQDNVRLIKVAASARVPTIAIGMGEIGQPTRILAARFGAPWVYASFNQIRVVAPGLMPWTELRDRYRVESIGPSTRIYGVVGDPIAHSLSPLAHNAALAATGFDGVYLPFRVSKDDFRKFIETSGELEIDGLSVTIPHKEAIVPLGNPADGLVHDLRSANTMVRTGAGARLLYNTDGPAAVAAIEAALPPDERGGRNLAGRNVMVLGAGGAARTIGASLAKTGCFLLISARRGEKAAELAQDLHGSVVDWAQRHQRHVDVVVNATPIGMTPDVEESPLHPSAIIENMVVMDTVYNPEQTKLLKEAKDRGAIAVSGVEMFVRQAEAQFRLFTGLDAPRDLMSTLVREELSPARNMIREARLASEAAAVAHADGYGKGHSPIAVRPAAPEPQRE